MNDQKILECLWVDLTTYEQKRDFLLLGRGVVTGIIAPSMQNVLAHDYNVIVELRKANAELEKNISMLEQYNGSVESLIKDIEAHNLKQQAKGIEDALSRGERYYLVDRYWIDVADLRVKSIDLEDQAKALKAGN
jgi:hypothetical protein